MPPVALLRVHGHGEVAQQASRHLLLQKLRQGRVGSAL